VMQTLETKIPPPLVAIFIALVMLGVARLTLSADVGGALRLGVAALIAVSGGAVAAAGARTFRRVGTTTNPTQPQTASTLVTSGIYRYTRNPMYVGLATVLVAWAVALSSVWALLGPLAFVLYINRFQIAPEERALTALFGPPYTAYMQQVRRWL